METSMESYWGEAECQECVRAVVVKKHDATDETQLSLKLNDIVIVLEKDETGWWGGHKEGKEKTGWFPGTCVRTLPPTPVLGQSVQAETSPPKNLQEVCDGTLQNSQTYQELVSEHEKLKREKVGLEEKLRQLQRKSDENQKTSQKTIAQLQGSVEKLEAQLSDSNAKLLAERNQKTVLQDENARLKEVMQVPSGAAQMVPSSDQKLKAETAQNDIAEASRATQATQATRAAQASQATQATQAAQASQATQATQAAEVKHFVSAVPGASSVTSGSAGSAGSGAIGGEAPPAGCVKQIREAFERRSTTPQRSERENRTERSYGSLGSIPTGCGYAGYTARDVPLPPSLAGRFYGPVEQQANSADFGLSPIRRGSRPQWLPIRASS